MASPKIYQAPGLDIHHLSENLTQWLEAQGYETQALNTPGGITVQGRQTRSWVQRQGVALNVVIIQQGDNLQVDVGTSKWAVQAVSGVAAAILFWPLLAVPAYAAYKQKEIIDEAWRFIDQYVASGGQMSIAMLVPTGGFEAPAAPQATTPCPACGQPVRSDTKFCDNCGAKLVVTCPECGATLRGDAKFCDSCGAAIKAG